MAAHRVVKAAEMEAMSPDERAQMVNEGSLDSLEALEPAFRARVEAKARRILADRGSLDAEPS